MKSDWLLIGHIFFKLCYHNNNNKNNTIKIIIYQIFPQGNVLSVLPMLLALRLTAVVLKDEEIKEKSN